MAELTIQTHSDDRTTIQEALPPFTWCGVLPRAISVASTAGMEVERMSDGDNTTNDMVSTGFGPPNEVTVLFDDKTVTFPFSTASTLADLAQRLAEERGPQSRQMLSVTVKLRGAIALIPGSAAGMRKFALPPLRDSRTSAATRLSALTDADTPPMACRGRARRASRLCLQ
jgi:hypothetical protein